MNIGSFSKSRCLGRQGKQMMNLKSISIRATVCLYMPASACVGHTQRESTCGGHRWIAERLLASFLHLRGCIVPCSWSFASQLDWLATESPDTPVASAKHWGCRHVPRCSASIFVLGSELRLLCCCAVPRASAVWHTRNPSAFPFSCKVNSCVCLGAGVCVNLQAVTGQENSEETIPQGNTQPGSHHGQKSVSFKDCITFSFPFC